MKIADVEITKMTKGDYDDVNWDNMKPFYTNIAKDVGIQKKRLGGNFAVAQAIHSEELRNHIKYYLYIEYVESFYLTIAYLFQKKI